MAPDVEPCACHGNAGKIDSSLLSNEVIYNYGANTESLLGNIILPTDALLCKDCNCTNDSHKAALNQLYDNVVAAITMASQNSIHTHDVMLLIYMIYRVMHTFYERIQGHLDRQDMLFDMNNRTKARFKGALRFIKNNEDTLKKVSLARKLLSKNDKEFWKEIRVMNSSNMPLPNVIDGVTGSVNIVDMWAIPASLTLLFRDFWRLQELKSFTAITKQSSWLVQPMRLRSIF